MNRETRRLIQTESTKPSTKNIPTTTTPIVLAQALAAKPKETSYSYEPRKTKSDIHSALNERYEVGGILRQGKDTLDRLDEKGLPTWGKWGIPLKLEAWTGSSISALPHFWLRDNCRCEKCVNQDTMQRAFDTFSIPQNIQPKEVRILKEGLQITWANDGHVSTYEWDWLVKHRKNTNIPMTAQEKKKAEEQHIYWDSSIASMPPSVHYDEIMADNTGVGKWTEQIRRFGFCYVEGCPVSPEKTQELLERISFIRVTHYGKLAHISSTTSLTQQGGFYDFTADLTMKDTAYTNLALPAHTDTTYFTDPAGLQMFHLLSHTSGSGGSSLLVDGFHAARTLLRESYSAYEILSKTPISWHASGNEGITITPAKKMPVLTFGDLREGEAPRLLQVRWNNDDRGVVALTEDGGMGAEKWYAAAAKWDEILKRKDMEYWAQLKPGRPLIFDNWRVLHGRSAFTGKRRICGGYINHDDYISRWRNTNYSRKEALAQIL
ncbi:related to Trimethyllysine dioxygenase [Rhynchosporium graminicola]|uniref:Trimethyllysine dioxygenase n=1 Tax=Rhynchosporium graminicola TaxID=2792576 RepID=A0A1E1K7N5_9HELO|nr:related to Trimethyllysine dioxygenase [Rhynchosporium commune]